MVSTRNKAKTQILNNKNVKNNSSTSSIGLRRSERIKILLLKKQGKKIPKVKFLSLPMSTEETKNVKKVKKKIETKNTITLSKINSVSSNSNDNVSKIREKFYNTIGRDELYRNKINTNEYNKDKYGNLAGNQYDLAMDNAFNGFYIAVLQLYNETSFDFKEPTKALEEKGFKVFRWTNMPSFKEFNDVLLKSCQLWLISHSYSKLNDEYLDMIKNFFESGKGVYIWGDNYPFYVDANKLSKHLFEVEMHGNVPGGKTVEIQKEPKKAGLVVENIINTGLDFLFEGITIATIKDHPDIEPVLYGSENNLVVASYNKDGKRAIIDGGFTRLYIDWKSAGTGRYVKNAAAWLANIENITI